MTTLKMHPNNDGNINNIDDMLVSLLKSRNICAIQLLLESYAITMDMLIDKILNTEIDCSKKLFEMIVDYLTKDQATELLKKCLKKYYVHGNRDNEIFDHELSYKLLEMGADTNNLGDLIWLLPDDTFFQVIPKNFIFSENLEREITQSSMASLIKKKYVVEISTNNSKFILERIFDVTLEEDIRNCYLNKIVNFSEEEKEESFIRSIYYGIYYEDRVQKVIDIWTKCLCMGELGIIGSIRIYYMYYQIGYYNSTKIIEIINGKIKPYFLNFEKSNAYLQKHLCGRSTIEEKTRILLEMPP